MANPSFLRLSCHGGRCCGAKHLHEFPPNPEWNLSATSAVGKTKGCVAQMNNPGKFFYNITAPKESALSRLDRVLTWCKENQPGGMIEVILGEYQKTTWGNHLEQRGFIMGPKFKNSNTHRVLQVYWLVNKT